MAALVNGRTISFRGLCRKVLPVEELILVVVVSLDTLDVLYCCCNFPVTLGSFVIGCWEIASSANSIRHLRISFQIQLQYLTCDGGCRGMFLLSIMQMAHLANTVYPITHVRFGIGRQVVDTLRSFNIKHELKFLFSVLQT